LFNSSPLLLLIILTSNIYQDLVVVVGPVKIEEIGLNVTGSSGLQVPFTVHQVWKLCCKTAVHVEKIGRFQVFHQDPQQCLKGGCGHFS